jgi:hypothetical protein
MKALNEFIAAHRLEVGPRFNNTFAFSWGKVIRRLSFLDILETRYVALSAEFSETLIASQKLMEAGGTSGKLTGDMVALLVKGDQLGTEIHLQIEAHYLFSKILLDDIAHAVEFYFGPVRGLPLDSHDDFVKNGTKYSEALGLTLSCGLLQTAAELKSLVSDLRDYQIAHEKSPRTIKGTSWSKSGRARMLLLRMYPKDSDQQIQTEDLLELRKRIEDNILAIIAFLKANHAKSNLNSTA